MTRGTSAPGKKNIYIYKIIIKKEEEEDEEDVFIPKRF